MSKAEGKSILRSMVVLVAALLFIYTIFFGIGPLGSIKLTTGEENNQEIPIGDDAFEARDEGEGNDDRDFSVPVLTSPSAGKSGDGEVVPSIRLAEGVREQGVGPVSNRPKDTPGRKFFSFQSLFDDAPENQGTTIPLSGTYQREGKLRSLVDYDLLGSAKYVLKTTKNNHFVYLGSFDTDGIPKVLKMGGNIVEIADKNDIHQHGLFGDRVLFLNTPKYQDLDKVIFIVTFKENNDSWFVQMDREEYYASKGQLLEIFDQRYDR